MNHFYNTVLVVLLSIFTFTSVVAAPIATANSFNTQTNNSSYQLQQAGDIVNTNQYRADNNHPQDYNPPAQNSDPEDFFLFAFIVAFITMIVNATR